MDSRSGGSQVTLSAAQGLWLEQNDRFSEDVDVFSPYKPNRPIPGAKHSEQLVEGASLARVVPPPIMYQLRMDQSFYTATDNSQPHLSNAQVEAIIYACQSFEQMFTDNDENFVEGTGQMLLVAKEYRMGFYLGDSTGVGKTRALAGIAHECMLNPNVSTKKVVWFTTSHRLIESIKFECEKFRRGTKILALADLKNDNLESDAPVTLILTYEMFKKSENLPLLTDWMTDDFDGLLVFDEAHIAKNACAGSRSSNRGIQVVNLQKRYSLARVVYSTATGASELMHWISFQRLGLWGEGTPFPTKSRFEIELVKKGIGAVELVALEMKMRGRFVSRQISLDALRVEKVNVPRDNDFELVYQRSSELFLLLVEYMDALTRLQQQEQRDGQRGARDEGSPNRVPQFYGKCQNFFAGLIMSSKISTVLKKAKAAVKRKECAVIGIQHTGEAQFKEFYKERKWNGGLPYSCVAYLLRAAMLHLGIRLGCPKTYINDREEAVKIGKWESEDEQLADGLYPDLWDMELEEPVENLSKRSRFETPATFSMYPTNCIGSFLDEPLLYDPSKITWSINSVQHRITADGLARLYHELYPFLPINPLDELIYCLEEKLRVVDLTGRFNAYKYVEEELDDGGLTKCWKIDKKMETSESVDLFMNGVGLNEQHVAIISACTSTGVSLHADRSCRNRKKRHHLTIEYGWGPEGLLQQLGRTHRSNQQHAPKYYIIQSTVPGEERFSSVISKRIKQLSAMQQGTVEAVNNLTQYLSDDLCTNAGATAINKGIDEFQKTVYAKDWLEKLKIPSMKILSQRNPTYYKKDLEEKVNKVFNRILLLPISQQRTFFEFVRTEYDTLEKKSTTYVPLREIMVDASKGFKQLPTQSINVAGVHSDIYSFEIDRTMVWEDAVEVTMDSSKGWNFWISPTNYRHTEIALISESIAGKRFAYFPFCRFETSIPGDTIPTGWTVLKEMHKARNLWLRSLQLLNENPYSCVEERLDQRNQCKRALELLKSKCMHQWGTTQFYVITNPTSSLIMKLDEQEMTFQLVLLKFSDQHAADEILGLYIGHDNCSNSDLKTLVGNLIGSCSD